MNAIKQLNGRLITPDLLSTDRATAFEGHESEWLQGPIAVAPEPLSECTFVIVTAQKKPMQCALGVLPTAILCELTRAAGIKVWGNDNRSRDFRGKRQTVLKLTVPAYAGNRETNVTFQSVLANAGPREVAPMAGGPEDLSPSQVGAATGGSAKRYRRGEVLAYVALWAKQTLPEVEAEMYLQNLDRLFAAHDAFEAALRDL